MPALLKTRFCGHTERRTALLWEAAEVRLRENPGAVFTLRNGADSYYSVRGLPVGSGEEMKR